MSKYTNYLSKKHSPVITIVGETEFFSNKDSMSKDDFEKSFFIDKDADIDEKYCKIITSALTEDEMVPFLLNKLIRQQAAATKSINVIKGIMVLYLILSLVAAFIIFVTFI